MLDMKDFMDECLFNLRLEIRCHTIFYLDLAFREGSYYIDEEDPSPDPYIDTLNADLNSIEEAMSTTLPLRIQR
jgi:exocyst complex component 4